MVCLGRLVRVLPWLTSVFFVCCYVALGGRAVGLHSADARLRLHADETVLLASGSADSSVYVYDVGGPSGSGKLLQKLDGHKDRVYSVSFHPQEPVLVSASADFTLR